MSNLFDKFFKKAEDKSESKQLGNQLTIDSRDGAINLEDSINEFILNMDWNYNSGSDLIETYREIASYNEVDFAVEDIINEAVSFSEDEDPVAIDVSDIEMSDTMKEKITESWNKISSLLDLKNTIYYRLKNFYVDGRLAYQKVINEKNVSNGLKNVIELDVKYITKIRNVIYNKDKKTIDSIEEYFIYDEKIDNKKRKDIGFRNNQFKEALKLNKESIAYVTSGMVDHKNGLPISWLHKAVKPANQLKMMENALIVYRIARAPERRVFYIDTGGQSPSKANQTLERLKNQYRNRMAYDPDSGSFKDKRHLMTMQEDYWLPRDSSGKGTEVSTLPGGQSLGELDDVIYFQKELYKSLNIPVSRLESDSLVSFGRQSEINRDELKFTKFVSKVRKRFSMVFLDLLRTDLLLTRTITVQEWNNIEHDIKFIFSQDLYLEEQKKAELLRDRVELARDLSEFVGKYISHDYIRREIFKQSDENIKEIDNQIKKEKSIEQYKEEPF